MVVYDEQSGIRAARAFWFLEYFGHPSVRLLDGGFGAWTGAGLPVTRDARAAAEERVDRHARGAHASRRGGRCATRSASRDAVILDTRSDGEYCGTTVRAQARRRRCPAPCTSSGRATSTPDGRLQAGRASCEKMYEDAGVTPDREVITYCQGGYRAAHAYLALRLLGYPRVRNYVGSWKEWGDRDDCRSRSSGTAAIADLTDREIGLR